MGFNDDAIAATEAAKTAAAKESKDKQLARVAETERFRQSCLDCAQRWLDQIGAVPTKGSSLEYEIQTEWRVDYGGETGRWKSTGSLKRNWLIEGHKYFARIWRLREESGLRFQVDIEINLANGSERRPAKTLAQIGEALLEESAYLSSAANRRVDKRRE